MGLLYAGRLTAQWHGLGFRVEWGPPMIWWPKTSLIRSDLGCCYAVGWLWWCVYLAKRNDWRLW